MRGAQLLFVLPWIALSLLPAQVSAAKPSAAKARATKAGIAQASGAKGRLQKTSASSAASSSAGSHKTGTRQAARTHDSRKDARASKEAAPTSYFMAANPHVPLAVVREGLVRGAVGVQDHGKTCGSKKRWGVSGSTWHALDAWGRFIGTATVDIIDHYDVTKCDEVYFAPKFHQNTNGTLFVSTDSAYKPGTSLEWAASGGAVHKLRALLGTVTGKRKKLPYVCSEIQKPIRTFHFNEGGVDKKLGVGGGDAGYVIASYEGGAWTAERSVQAKADERECYRPVAVFDMNGDGQPEVVMRIVKGDGELWGDMVLSRDASGRWTTVAMSPGGATL